MAAISRNEQGPFDIFVIGGGVNGCGVARDASGRGYRVGLAERDDLASGTSSKSTKLIHGGLRYLESLDIGMVRQALRERETLWANAPHLIQPLRFVLPVEPGIRPAWLLRFGLFLYDHLGGREKLPATATLDLRRAAAGRPLRDNFVKAFEYSDCRVDDSRLVILNARDAADRGAAIFTRTEVVAARVESGVWRIRLRDMASGDEMEVSARLLVNAAGPWADGVLRRLAPARKQRLRLVRGSHIVTAKLFEGDGAYLFQNPDGRVVFAIAWQEDFTLIGATDVEHRGLPGAVAITPEESDYLRRSANAHFRRNIGPEDVVWSFSGLRPLFNDHAATASRVTREHVVETLECDGAPLICLFGGKITAYRRLAEEVLQRAGGLIGACGKPWTARAPLPGGDFSGGDLDAFVQDLRAQKPFLDAALARRLARAYGTRCLDFLGAAREMADLGEDFGAGLTRAEVDYLVAREWARTVDDILWRRSKLGLRVSRDGAAKLAAFLDAYGAAALAGSGR